MNDYSKIIFPICLYLLIAGCTYNVEEVYFSENCKTSYTGFPDIPGWSYKAIPIEPAITYIKDVYFLKESKGLMFTDKNIWLTEDDGAHWENVFTMPSSEIYDISFPDQLNGFVAVATQNDKHILKTIDGGRTWSSIIYQPLDKIVHFSFSDDHSGLASLYHYDYNPSLRHHYNAKTNDGGLTWEEIPGLSFSFLSIPTIHMYPNGFGYIPGDSAQIHFTSDFGVSWKTIHTGFDYLRDIRFSDEENGFVNEQYLYKTIDGGNSWTKISEYSPHWYYFFSPMDGISLQTIDTKLDFDSANSCNAFFTTSDGGVTWNEGPPSINFYMKDVNFINDNVGYGLTYENDIRIVKLFR